MEILIILATGFMCLLSFLCGYKCSKNEEIISNDIKENILHPIETYKNNVEEKEIVKKNKIKKMQDEVVLENIDNYRGGSLGQKPIPFLDNEEGDDF